MEGDTTAVALLNTRLDNTVKLKYYTDRDSAEELACRFTTKSLLALDRAVSSAEDSLEGNSNVRLTLMGLAVELSN